MTARVFVSQFIYPEAVDELRAAGLEVVARQDDAPLPTEQLAAEVSACDGLVCLLTDRIDDEVLQAAPGLKVVSNVAVGYDNIDVPAATRAGVAVCNTPGVLTDATADLAMTLLLATARRVPEADTHVRAGRFDRWRLHEPLIGADVTGRHLGIIGLGEIGRAVAHRAAAGFGMRVSYHNTRRLPQHTETELGVDYLPLPQLLAECDFISIHAPLVPETRHLIDTEALAMMKPTAVLINTARGPIVDEQALAAALADGQLAGAGLDVFEHEPQVHPALLEQRERVVLMPHLGSATHATRQQMAIMAVRNVIAVLGGQRPAGFVNPEVNDSGTDRRTGT